MMPRSPFRDLLAGLFVAAGLCALVFLALRVGTGPRFGDGGLTLRATFEQVAGLKEDAPVDIAGVTVGRVRQIALRPDYRAEVTFELESDVALPTDSSASIVTAGLLGDRYLALQIGGADEFLADGDEIEFTESAIVLERLLGKLVHNLGNKP